MCGHHHHSVKLSFTSTLSFTSITSCGNTADNNILTSKLCVTLKPEHCQSRWTAVIAIMSREDMASFLNICKSENIAFSDYLKCPYNAFSNFKFY